jgi:dienelactone hydrolase
MPEALASLESDQEVRVSSGEWYTFEPTTQTPTSGLILYPGGRVDPRAYAAVARGIAAEGNLVVIVPMPLNLAFFGTEKASDVIAAHPEIEHWVIGGHSLGGAFAAEYVAGRPDMVDGLVLWAAYPADNNDLSRFDGTVFSIYGTLDGVATEDEVVSALRRLPPQTRWIPIDGGNHAQFGAYGQQSGDSEPGITRAEQQAQIVSATAGALAESRGEFDWQPCCELH